MKYRTTAPLPMPKKLADGTVSEGAKGESPEPKSDVWRAMLDFIIQTDEGRMPDQENIAVLRRAFVDVMSGQDARVIFKSGAGGRSADRGFTRAAIVSCFIELQRRELIKRRGQANNALTQAKWAAMTAFVDIQGADLEREIDRCWQHGQAMVEGMTDKDLHAILEPHQVEGGKVG